MTASATKDKQRKAGHLQHTAEKLLIERAWSAYTRRARQMGEALTNYSPADSFFKDGLIVLRSESDTLAVFGLSHQKLRKLERGDWPEQYRSAFGIDRIGTPKPLKRTRRT